MLSESRIDHFLCVATSYGSDVMEKSPYVVINVGRMDSEGMTLYMDKCGFGEEDMVVDVTHPYAVEVSRNIIQAAEKKGCRLLRVERDKTGEKEDEKEDGSYVNYIDSIESFARLIGDRPGNILLTTGSRDLPVYCGSVSDKTLERTYIRVLPAEESIRACSDLGIKSTNIIAMHGPFSYELNAALFRQYDIRHILTKDSGTTGGYPEKVMAASDLGISVYVLKRPEKEGNTEGFSVYKAFEEITGRRYEPKRTIVLAGAGPGGWNALTIAAAESLSAADAVFGAKRVLDPLYRDSDSTVSPSRHITGRRYDMYRAGDIIEVLDNEPDIRNAVILFSGDTGFYSGAGACRKELESRFKDADITVIPGISSVSYLVAVLHETYDDAVVTSIHGRNSLHNIEKLTYLVRNNRKTFALMSDDSDVRKCAKMLGEAGIDATVICGINLSGDINTGSHVNPDQKNDESVIRLSIKEAQTFVSEGLITVLFINDNHEKSHE